MPGYKSILLQRKALPLFVSLFLLLVFTLSACGTNTTTGGTVSTPSPASTPATPASQDTANGCPDSTPVTNAPADANVILKTANSNSTVNVKKGDTVEIDLAFGQRWEGPDGVSKSLLTQQASGYADAAKKMCVWRFLAIGTGTVHMDFVGHPICKKGDACPQYIQAVPFTLEIK